MENEIALLKEEISRLSKKLNLTLNTLHLIHFFIDENLTRETAQISKLIDDAFHRIHTDTY